MIDRTSKLILLSMAVSAPAAADPLPKPPAFAICSGCHVSKQGQTSTIGPNLFGVSLRKSGEYPGYSYSAAMKSAAVVWDRETLSAFVRDPKKTIPGTKMGYSGQMDPQKLQEVVDYVLSLK